MTQNDATGELPGSYCYYALNLWLKSSSVYRNCVVTLQSSQICTVETVKTSSTRFKSSVRYLPENVYKQFSIVLCLITNKKEGWGLFRHPYTGKQKGVRGWRVCCSHQQPLIASLISLEMFTCRVGRRTLGSLIILNRYICKRITQNDSLHWFSEMFNSCEDPGPVCSGLTQY